MRGVVVEMTSFSVYSVDLPSVTGWYLSGTERTRLVLSQMLDLIISTSTGLTATAAGTLEMYF